MPDRIEKLATEVFGFSALRPGQREAIRSITSGRDTLVVMPTGSGKSAVYQIAALLMGGPAVVVSPLLALQREQAEALQERDAGGAARANSQLSGAAQERALGGFEDEDLQFLFLAPEQLTDDETLTRLRAAKPALLVVDEAHCISEWGHDFRPDYRRLGAVAEAIGRPALLALTATASPWVRQDIAEHLRMRDPVVISAGFDRPNIRLCVERVAHESAQRKKLIERVVEVPKPGIVYVATRRAAEETAQEISERDVRARPYHGGLNRTDRNVIHEDFTSDRIEVVVATTAFGMGVDKPNVRFVYHLHVSPSVDSYYQEIGRAGRDGAPAEALLFYRQEDLGIRRFFAASGRIDRDEVEAVMTEAARSGPEPVPPSELKERTGLSQTKLAAAIGALEMVGALEVLPAGQVKAKDVPPGASEIASAAAATAESHEKLERSRVEMMRGYAETSDCRRTYLLEYFGEQLQAPCDNCDNCLQGKTKQTEMHEGAAAFAPGAPVEHRRWGRGRVVGANDDEVVVVFEKEGYKTLSLEIVTEKGLLTELTRSPAQE
jgi:ATP-dependent DNA helicase RecQ